MRHDENNLHYTEDKLRHTEAICDARKLLPCGDGLLPGTVNKRLLHENEFLLSGSEILCFFS